MAKAINRWAEVISKYPEASSGAKLLMAERLELADLNKLKSFPVMAILLLETSIKEHADELLQRSAAMSTSKSTFLRRYEP